ncbi:MAG: hypothetical protein N2109_07205 [Fimbriimonadales bacterium]|nr:hypothetical protein [Fimbriimonadales bacterium]
MAGVRLVGLWLALGTVGLAQGEGEASPRVSGVLFGDLYGVLGHHDRSVEGKSGTWIRRINLTFDAGLGEGLSTRFRLEAKDPGDFRTESELKPYAKDLWIRWERAGHAVLFGLVPTPTAEAAETELAYRPIEKHTLDLFRMGWTRDKGLGFQGPLDRTGRWVYQVVLGDASGTESSSGDTRAAYGRLGWKPAPGLLLDLYADWWDRKHGEEWTTWKLEAVRVGASGKLGLVAAAQRRSQPGQASRTLEVGSLYAEWNASVALKPFLWVHASQDPIPGAEDIDYFRMSPDGKPTVWLLGARWRIAEAVELVPVLVRVEYREADDRPKPDPDTFLRLTFSAKF